MPKSLCSLVALIIFSNKAVAHSFIAFDHQPYVPPHINNAQAELDSQGRMNLTIVFEDSDEDDLWQAMLCSGNLQKPEVCYQQLSALVYPDITNLVSLSPTLSPVVWWIEIRDLFGAKAMSPLNMINQNREIYRKVMVDKLEGHSSSFSLHLQKQHVPINVVVKDSGGEVLYQRSFVTEGSKTIDLSAYNGQNLMLYYSGIADKGHIKL